MCDPKEGLDPLNTRLLRPYPGLQTVLDISGWMSKNKSGRGKADTGGISGRRQETYPGGSFLRIREVVGTNGLEL